jgi:hypothetical protein
MLADAHGAVKACWSPRRVAVRQEDVDLTADGRQAEGHGRRRAKAGHEKPAGPHPGKEAGPTMATASPRTALCAVIMLASLCSGGPGAEAFGPAAHVCIAEAVTQQLPAGSPVRVAMEAEPRIAAAGANGPDLGYLNARGLLPDPRIRYAPWGDRFHYDRVGTFAATQLRMALASGNKGQIAWAAGWVTHVAGDLACHSIFVNPEAGVWMVATPAQRALHKRLEQHAEPYVWEDLAGHPAGSYRSEELRKSLCDDARIPADAVSRASLAVYGEATPDDRLDGFRTWYGRLLTAVGRELLGLEVGYKYTDHAEALAALSEDDRLARLKSAFGTAVRSAAELCDAAQKGGYTGFTDRWNLDAGAIGTLTVRVHTADASGAGTDADVYFGLALDDGTEHEWSLDKPGYNDFERNDTDDYYLYFPSEPQTQEHIRRVWLRMGARHGVAPGWRCGSVAVACSGRQVCAVKVDRRFAARNDRWQAEVGGR